jgi:glyoxylase-like metal-dependent hydrolase (beta-lactamase superfamily II)
MKSFVVGACLVIAALVAALCAPYGYAEYALPRHGALVGPAPSVPVEGRWFDDYFLVQTLDVRTFAIGEPRYYQGNYSYLLLGDRQALLFDSGTGVRNMVPVVRSLTSLPVTVVPSHLHFDHVGGLGRFERTALLDDPDLRARTHAGVLRLGRYEFLGFADGLEAPRVRVDEWWLAGSDVDLGGRQVRVLHTPGHTPTSVSLYDADRKLLFCGDFIYPGELYAFLPGASRSAYRSTTDSLLAVIDPAARIFTAHLAEDPKVVTAPELRVADLMALRRTLVAMQEHAVQSTGFYPRVYPVSPSMQFATGFPWNNR